MHDASIDILAMMQLAVAEGLVWRAVEMYQHLDLGALAGSPQGRQVAAASDTPVQIALVSLTDLALAVRSALRPAAPMLDEHPQVYLRLPCWLCLSALKAGLMQDASFFGSF